MTPPKSYLVEGHEALFFDMGSDDGFYVEPYGDHFSLAWTTTRPAGALLELLQELLPRGESGTWTVTTEGQDERLTGPLEAVFDRLATHDELLDFWRFDLPDHALTWERKQASDDCVERGLMGFIGVRFSEDALSRLIEATASPMVSSRVWELLPQGARAVNAAQELRHSVE